MSAVIGKVSDAIEARNFCGTPVEAATVGSARDTLRDVVVYLGYVLGTFHAGQDAVLACAAEFDLKVRCLFADY